MKTLLFLLLLLCLITLAYCQQDGKGNLVLITDAKSAKCLDGSPIGFYFFQGFGEGQDKFLIYLQGGGLCQGENNEELLEQCYQRSKTALGSSKKWSKIAQNSGNLSNNQQSNPAFYNWNKIYVQYCDGYLYQGSASIPYKNTTLHFKGYDNMVEIFNYLIQNYGIQSSKMIVLSGGSAGGLGAFYWNQYLRKIINSNVIIIAAPDSGFFIDIPGSDNSQKYKQLDLLTNGNRSIIQPQGCPYLEQNDLVYKCSQPQFIIDQMPVPVFIINSLYDSYTLNYILQINCITPAYGLQNCSSQDIQKVELLRNLTFTELQQIQAKKPNWGIWAISCLYHVFSESIITYSGSNYEVPMNSDFTVSHVLNEFIQQQLSSQSQNNFYIDQVAYPNNSNCNGLSSFYNKYIQNQQI
ncbi:hypothetical protein ABPG72_016583 [Tetrahymena utriculariae]